MYFLIPIFSFQDQHIPYSLFTIYFIHTPFLKHLILREHILKNPFLKIILYFELFPQLAFIFELQGYSFKKRNTKINNAKETRMKESKHEEDGSYRNKEVLY